MKRRLFSVFGVLLLLAMMAIPSAYAAPGQYRGYELGNSGYSGLRAIMSTGTSASGSPPHFYFPAKSPDVYQEFTQYLYPRNACIRAQVTHKHVAGSGTTQNRLEFVDLTTGGIGYFDLTDAAFRAQSVRNITYNDTGTAFQDDVVDVRVYNTSGNTWVGEVWDFNLSIWRTYKTVTCTRNETGYVDIGDQGYTQDPTMSCPTLYPWNLLQIRGIKKYSGGTWNFITSGDITYYEADNWPCITANQYMVASPYVYQIKLKPYGTSF